MKGIYCRNLVLGGILKLWGVDGCDGALNKEDEANKKSNTRGFEICASTSNFDLLVKKHFF